eukprot:1358826-Rhodomonas_salina.1
MDEKDGVKVIDIETSWGKTTALLTKRGTTVLPEAADDGRIFVLLMVCYSPAWDFDPQSVGEFAVELHDDCDYSAVSSAVLLWSCVLHGLHGNAEEGLRHCPRQQANGLSTGGDDGRTWGVL